MSFPLPAIAYFAKLKVDKPEHHERGDAAHQDELALVGQPGGLGWCWIGRIGDRLRLASLLEDLPMLSQLVVRIVAIPDTVVHQDISGANVPLRVVKLAQEGEQPGIFG